MCVCGGGGVLKTNSNSLSLPFTNVFLRLLVQKFVRLIEMIDIYGVWIWKTLKCSGSLRHDSDMFRSLCVYIGMFLPVLLSNFNQMNLSSDKSLNKPV